MEAPAAAIPPPVLPRASWTKALDLRLVRAVQHLYGGDAWRSNEDRRISWKKVLKYLQEQQGAPWPEAFNSNALLKKRWEDTFRIWCRNEEDIKEGRRAQEVIFEDLIRRIEARDYSAPRKYNKRARNERQEEGEEEGEEEEEYEIELLAANNKNELQEREAQENNEQLRGLSLSIKAYIKVFIRFNQLSTLHTHSGITFDDPSSLIRQLTTGININDIIKIAKACLPSRFTNFIFSESTVPNEIKENIFILPDTSFNDDDSFNWHLLAVIIPDNNTILQPYLLICTSNVHVPIDSIPAPLRLLRRRTLLLFPDQAITYRAPLIALSILVHLSQKYPSWSSMLDTKFDEKENLSVTLLSSLLSQPEVRISFSERDQVMAEQRPEIREPELFETIPKAINLIVPMEPWFLNSKIPSQHIVDAVKNYTKWALFVVSASSNDRVKTSPEAHWSGDEKKCVLVLEVLRSESEGRDNKQVAPLLALTYDNQRWNLETFYPIRKLWINNGPQSNNIPINTRRQIDGQVYNIRFIVKGTTFSLNIGDNQIPVAAAAPAPITIDPLPRILSEKLSQVDSILDNHGLTRRDDQWIVNPELLERVWSKAKETLQNFKSLFTERQIQALLKLEGLPRNELPLDLPDRDAFEAFWDLIYLWIAPILNRDIIVLYIGRDSCILFNSSGQEQPRMDISLSDAREIQIQEPQDGHERPLCLVHSLSPLPLQIFQFGVYRNVSIEEPAAKKKSSRKK